MTLDGATHERDRKVTGVLGVYDAHVLEERQRGAVHSIDERSELLAGRKRFEPELGGKFLDERRAGGEHGRGRLDLERVWRPSAS